MMKEILVKLNSVDKVKDFVRKTTKCDSSELDLDLISGRYVVDAKSIMGIFSLDLTKNLTLRIYSNNESNIKKLENDLKEYIV